MSVTAAFFKIAFLLLPPADVLIMSAKTNEHAPTVADTPWYVYMVFCADDTLYTGITTDLERRLKEHNGNGKGARYTRSRQPVRLAYYEEHPTRSDAGKREACIKGLDAKAKRRLVKNSADLLNI